MTALKQRFESLLIVLAVLSFAGVSAEAREDRFVVAIEEQNEFLEGGAAVITAVDGIIIAIPPGGISGFTMGLTIRGS